MIRILQNRARALADEAGFSIVEMMMALSMISIGFLALAGTASTGARMLAEARQRQAATEIAGREIEHLRNIPYDEVAFTTGLTRSSDPDDPDFWLSDDGLSYDHQQDGTFEPLVIDANGVIEHTEDIAVGPTLLTVHRYVTWVDDPAITGTEDYKRLTIVAFYRAPVNTGRAREVRASALFTPGTVFVPGEQASGATGGGGSPTPSPSPTPTGACSGDTTAPTGTFSILSGTGAAQGFTSSTTVTISMSPTDACAPITVELSNDNVAFGTPVTYDVTNPTATWVIPGGDGSKSVWARFTDGVGNSRVVGPQAIVLDQTLPTAPTSLSKSLSCSGQDRTAALSWGASSDANLLGYRLYRSIDSGAFEVAKTTSMLTASDTHKKNLDSVRFYVVAYDKAGNEGIPSDEISLAKNQCA